MRYVQVTDLGGPTPMDSKGLMKCLTLREHSACGGEEDHNTEQLGDLNLVGKRVQGQAREALSGFQGRCHLCGEW